MLFAIAWCRVEFLWRLAYILNGKPVVTQRRSLRSWRYCRRALRSELRSREETFFRARLQYRQLRRLPTAILWPGSHAVLYTSPIEFNDPGLIDSDFELNSAEVNSPMHTMTEENCGFWSTYAFDSAHVKLGVWIKAGTQPLFPAEQIRIRPAVLNWFRRHTSHELNSLNSIRLVWSTASEPGLSLKGRIFGG